MFPQPTTASCKAVDIVLGWGTASKGVDVSLQPSLPLVVSDKDILFHASIFVCIFGLQISVKKSVMRQFLRLAVFIRPLLEDSV
jgi:hypothetical protein